MRAATIASIIATVGLSFSALADNSKNEAQEISIDQKIQIVGTIAQSSKKGAQSGVVILKDSGAQKMIFAELGKPFQIDQRSFIIVRIDLQGAVIANTTERYDLAYINPPSNSANTLVYETESNDTTPEATSTSAERTAELSTKNESPASPASPQRKDLDTEEIIAEAETQSTRRENKPTAESRDTKPAVDTSPIEQSSDDKMQESDYSEQAEGDEYQQQDGLSDDSYQDETVIEPSSDVYQFQQD
jgi:hypothetical protein